MKSLLKSVLVTSLLFSTMAAFDSRAATTNVVQHINVQLTLITQGPERTNRFATNEVMYTVNKVPITTKRLISWLGAALNGPTNTFSPKASLVRVRHVGAETNRSTIEIRDGTHAPVDVTAFFAGTRIANQVRSSTYNARSGVSTGNDFGVLHVTMTNAPPYSLVPHFVVSGMERSSYVSAQNGKVRIMVDEMDAENLVGHGADTNGVTGIVQGSISVHGTAVEVK